VSIGTISLTIQPYIGYRFLDYEVYKVTATQIYVVNWVNSQTRVYNYIVVDSNN
jgi:hypothetical protein